MKLSEDWQATILGLLLVLIVGSGLLGPGPQNVAIKAGSGATTTAHARAINGWQITATLNGKSLQVENAPAILDSSYTFTCENGEFSALNTGQASEAGLVQITLDNRCDAEVAVTLKTAPAIPWPLFSR